MCRSRRTRQGAAERFGREATAAACSELAIQFEPPARHVVDEPRGSDDQVRMHMCSALGPRSLLKKRGFRCARRRRDDRGRAGDFPP